MTRTLPSSEKYQHLRRRLEEQLGPKGILAEAADLAPYLIESRGLWTGWAPFMALPASTQEVAETVRICREEGIAIVPQGGNTSRVASAFIQEEDGAILLNLRRMDRVLEVDPLDNSITVQAGCVLQRVQEEAAAVDRLFPLSLGAEGSCQIGGNLASNAGGLQVLRYGNARDLVLGIEVVLPDGRVWDGLRALRKNNTGYDLKQLFIGAEGTLGIITAATLKLYPRPKESISLFIGLRDLEASCHVLALAQGATGGQVVGCELIPRIALDFTLRQAPDIKDPLSAPHDWYVLMKAAAGRENSGLREALEQMLAEAYEAGLVVDATIAASEAQSQALWRIREVLVEAQALGGASIKHDVSVPVSKVPAFIQQANATAAALVPGIRPYAYGHMGDGNVHYNLSQPEALSAEDFMARQPEIQRRVHDVAISLGGSISAEHGVGLTKRAEIARVKPPIELELMRRLKAALDPEGLMNPGKILIPESD
jgi:D-lactate dehydrogenase (cytochrome)